MIRARIRRGPIRYLGLGIVVAWTVISVVLASALAAAIMQAAN